MSGNARDERSDRPAPRASGASVAAPDARTRALAAASAIALVVIAATVAPRPRRDDARVACREVEPWMAEALPGVGPGGRDAALAAIRCGEVGRLPPRARDDARAWFDFAAPQPSSGIVAASAAQQRRTWRKTAAKPSSAP